MDWEAFYNHFREPNFVPGYEIQNRLGGGAFGEVYKARKHSIGKAYAIKFLKIDDDAQREAVERELEQVRHFAAIDHPNLVTIEDLGTVMGVPYLIMGYAGEETLARTLRSQTLSAQNALLYFVQACRGVLALHDRRLVHFDLKPSNIFIKGDIARVGDYGLSKMLTDGRLTLSFGRGTPQYMAPEMLKNRADHRADLYSLGVILFESVSGKVPFVSSVPGTLALREDDLPPKFPPDFPAALRPTVERCLRMAPDDRYASVSELLEDLGQTARPGDSIRIDWTRTPTDTPRVLRPDATPTPASPDTSEVRQTAAELTRGAVQIALGMWEGLRTASGSPRAPAGGNPRATTSGSPRETAGGSSRATEETPARNVARQELARAPTPPMLPAAPPSRAPDPFQVQDDAVEMIGLSEGAPPRTALVVPATGALATDARVAELPERGTIPVPPMVKGGWLGTVFATLLLSMEILVALGRTLLRKVGVVVLQRQPLRTAQGVGVGALAVSRRVVGGSVRLLLFVLALALLGGLVTFTAILFLSEGNR